MPAPDNDATDPNLALYDDAILAWSEQQSALLRAGDFAALDIEHLAEEIEGVGSSQRHEVRRRLARLLQHLLKWHYQPGFRGPSWRTTIRVQRTDLQLLVEDSPSIRARLGDLLPGEYRLGGDRAELESGMTNLPETCPFSVEQLLDTGFLSGINPKSPLTGIAWTTAECATLLRPTPKSCRAEKRSAFRQPPHVPVRVKTQFRTNLNDTQ